MTKVSVLEYKEAAIDKVEDHRYNYASFDNAKCFLLHEMFDLF